MKMSKTNDGGRTWSTPSIISSALPSPLGTCDALPVLRPQRDGALVVLYLAPSPCKVTAPARLAAMRSIDGGMHWSTPVAVATRAGWSDAGDIGQAMAKMTGPGLSAPVTAPDGTIWWAWPDVTVDAATNAAETVIRLTSSLDDGQTWTESSAVRTVPFVVMNTNLVVGPDGTFGLLSYDFRNEADFAGGVTTDVWFATFRANGREWVEHHLATFDALSVPDSVGGYQGVDRVSDGFAVAFTAGLPMATAGQTDVLFTRIVAQGSSVQP